MYGKAFDYTELTEPKELMEPTKQTEPKESTEQTEANEPTKLTQLQYYNTRCGGIARFTRVLFELPC